MLRPWLRPALFAVLLSVDASAAVSVRWNGAEYDMREPTLIPDKVCNVRDFGARGDGMTSDTAAITGAIASWRGRWAHRAARSCACGAARSCSGARRATTTRYFPRSLASGARAT